MPDTKEPIRPSSLTATMMIANTANVVVVLCGMFALGSVVFAPPELLPILLRVSVFTALGVSLLSIVAHAVLWILENRHPERPHAVQHWLSAHAASVAGFMGANWIWLHP